MCSYACVCVSVLLFFSTNWFDAELNKKKENDKNNHTYHNGTIISLVRTTPLPLRCRKPTFTTQMLCVIVVLFVLRARYTQIIMNIGFQLLWNLNTHTRFVCTQLKWCALFNFSTKCNLNYFLRTTHVHTIQRGNVDAVATLIRPKIMLRYLTNQTKSLLLSDPINSASF